MIQDKILGWKRTIEPEVMLELIQLIAGLRAFHFTNSKTKFDIQEVISPYYFDKILISNTP